MQGCNDFEMCEQRCIRPLSAGRNAIAAVHWQAADGACCSVIAVRMTPHQWQRASTVLATQRL